MSLTLCQHYLIMKTILYDHEKSKNDDCYKSWSAAAKRKINATTNIEQSDALTKKD